MSKIQTIKDAIRLCGEVGITPFLWGVHGVGKSSVVNQICEEDDMGMVDMRCSLLESSDLRGFMDRKDGRTIFLPPEDMPHGDMTSEEVKERLESILDGATYEESSLKARNKYKAEKKRVQGHYERGILFLDELNRGADDVIQAAFQLCLDGAVGQYVLPDGWFPVAAGNYAEGYLVNNFNDPAFIDRFCHLIFPAGASTYEDWAAWAATHVPNAEKIIQFTAQNIKHLDGEVNADLGFNITPSRRSWAAVGRVLSVASKYSQEAVGDVIAGLVGVDMAIGFENYNCPITPQQVIEGRTSNKELKELGRGQLVGLMWGVISAVTEDDTCDQKIANRLLGFAEYLIESTDKDLGVAFCRSLVGKSFQDTSIKSFVVSNPVALKLINDMVGKVTILDHMRKRPKLQEILSEVTRG